MGHRIDVLERLAAVDPGSPPVGFDQAGADRVLAEILDTPRSRRLGLAWPRRRVVSVAVAAIVVGILAPTLAFSGVRGLLDSRNPAVLEESRLLVSAPVADRTVARLWTAPAKAGAGECAFVTYGPPGPAEHATEQGGGVCFHGRPSADTPPVSLSISMSKRPLRPRGATEWVPPLVSGRVDPRLAPARVELRWTGGSKDLETKDGFFVGAAEELYEPPPEAFPFFLVAYDANGKELARHKIDSAWLRLD